jgi:hypothetical protein
MEKLINLYELEGFRGDIQLLVKAFRVFFRVH